MIKKILFIIFSIFFIAQAAFSQEFRVTSVNFDTSNSLIFLTSPDNTEEAIMKNVKLLKMENPKRVYFDINSAVLTAPPQNWFLNSGGVKQVKVNQFSTNPGKIRVVFYLEDDFDASKISFLKVNNNIVIKFKDIKSGTDYFQNTYRDEKSSSSDFYENLSISSEELDKAKQAVNSESKDEVLNQLQQAFNSATPQNKDNTKPVASVKSPDTVKKELKLKSKYYMSSIMPKTNSFLISGFGVVGVEKPMYLTNPARAVFDIPNTIVNQDIRDKEIKIGVDTVKVSQFSPSKARLVITSNELEKYYPIFSSDGQSILFNKDANVDIDSLCSKTTDAVGYYVRKINPTTNEFIIAFNMPVVHSVKRNDSKLTLEFYNALRYNDRNFKNAIEMTDLKEMKMDLLPKIGLKLALPLEKNATVSCFQGADARSVKIIVRGLNAKNQVCTTSERTIILPKCIYSGKKSVVIDPGHGGSDYGAIRAGINEKDINLDISKRVQSILMNKGVVVYMTRNSDETVSLQDRTIFCANSSPGLFVSIHVNSSVKPEITGLETHYYHENSIELAQTVHADIVSYVKSKDRGLFKSKFYVINHTEVPAILCEIGFMSNDAERAELVSEERKDQTAQAIANGILKYLNKK